MTKINTIKYILISLVFSSIIAACDSGTLDPFGESNAFIKFYGGAGSDVGVDVLEMPSGEFILLGTSTSFDTIGTQRNTSDIYVVKTDNFGNEIWSKTYGDNSKNEIASQITATQDGGFAIIGTQTDQAGFESNIYWLKIDSAGNALNSQSIRGTEVAATALNTGNSIQATLDGGFILVGDTRLTSGADTARAATDMYIIKLTSTGAIDWDRPYGFVEDKDDTGDGILEANDGDFIWFGTNVINQGGQRFTKMRVVRSNNIGNLRWDRFYGVDNANVEARDIQRDTPGYILAGVATIDNQKELIITKVDEDGDLIWQTVFGDADNEEIESVTPLLGGGYAVTGQLSHPGDSNEGSFIIIYLIDGQGNVTSSTNYGRLEEGIDEANAIIQTREGSFVIIGKIAFEANEMMCLIKIEPTAFSPVN